MAYQEDNDFNRRFANPRIMTGANSGGSRDATYRPSTSGVTPEVKPSMTDELGRTQSKPASAAAITQQQSSPNNLSVEQLTKRPGGLMVVGGKQSPSTPALGGAMASETAKMTPVTENKPNPGNDYFNKQMLVDNNAMSRGDAGLTRYTQGPNGELLRQGSGGEISTLSGPPVRNRQSPGAEAAGTTDAWYNNGYPGGVAQYRQEKQQQGLYQAMSGLQSDAMNPNLSKEARENAAQMFGALAGRLNAMDAQYTQGQSQQIQSRNQQAQLGLQRQQYDDQSPERNLNNQLSGIKSRALNGDNQAMTQLNRFNAKPASYEAVSDESVDNLGNKTKKTTGVLNSSTGEVTRLNQNEQSKAMANFRKAIELNKDKPDVLSQIMAEYDQRFGGV